MRSLPRKKLTPAETELRDFSLEFLGSTEDFPWGHRAFKVNKKIFATLVSEREITTISMKLPKSGKAALKEPFSEPTHYGMGKHGWVTMTFDVGDDLPVARLKAWIDESYRAIAPKKLVTELGATTRSPSASSRGSGKPRLAAAYALEDGDLRPCTGPRS